MVGVGSEKWASEYNSVQKFLSIPNTAPDTKSTANVAPSPKLRQKQYKTKVSH